MKAVRVLAVADASAQPGLRRALSPESVELVGVASTPTAVLAQMRRVCPDVVVVDLSLSQHDVFQLIEQLVQEHVVVLALASGDEAASLAARAHAAGASDVVERRTAAGSWHEESGSPHVLSLRVLALAASARPRPSKLSLRLSGLATSAVPPLSAADSLASTRRASPLARSLLEAEPSASVPGASSAPAGTSKPARGVPQTTVSSAPAGSSKPARGVPQTTAGAAPPGTSSMRALGLPPTAASASPVAGTGAPPSASGFSRRGVSAAPAGTSPIAISTSQAAGAGAPPSAARVSALPRSVRPGTGRPLMAAQVDLVAIGASTGGTLALAELLKSMPESAPPMLVVQHMLPEFTNDFAQRLNELCELHVRVAVDRELVEPGTVLLAPGGRHLRVMRDAEQRLRARVTDELPVGKHRPSVDVLFQACAETLGGAVVGVLLTGMGDDGARGLLALHNSGARTLVQDQASSVCFGMPSAAIALGAAQQILPLRDIAHALRELVKTRSSVRV